MAINFNHPIQSRHKGEFIGTLGELYGEDCTIQFEKDPFLYYSHRTTIIVNGERVVCSRALTDIIRKDRLEEKVAELKKFLICEYPGGIVYLIAKRQITDPNNEYALTDDEFPTAEELDKLVKEYDASLWKPKSIKK